MKHKHKDPFDHYAGIMDGTCHDETCGHTKMGKMSEKAYMHAQHEAAESPAYEKLETEGAGLLSRMGVKTADAAMKKMKQKY
jgi:hypothetical protein